MISPADAEFHDHDPSATTWAETIGFWFAIPDEAIYGNIYLLARPEVGATISSVNVVQGHNRSPFTVDFTDPQVHAPCPESMLHFRLASGVQVDVDDAPTGYRFGYESRNGACSMALAYRGVMPAWDPNDPSDNPLLDPSVTADHGLGDAWAGGHLDFVGHVTGEVQLRGRTHAVDAMGGMDRSWGARSEFGEAAISYLHVPFGDDFGIHLVMGAELDRGRTVYGPLRFGYVYDHGATYGVTAATMTGTQAGLVPMAVSLTVTDTRDRTYTVHGAAVASAPWYTFSPSYGAFQSLMRWELDGRAGYGVVSDVLGIEFLADRTSRNGTRTASSWAAGS